MLSITRWEMRRCVAPDEIRACMEEHWNTSPWAQSLHYEVVDGQNINQHQPPRSHRHLMMHDFDKIARQTGGATLKASLDKQAPLHGIKYSPSVDVESKGGSLSGNTRNKEWLARFSKRSDIGHSPDRRRIPLVEVANDDEFTHPGTKVIGYLN